MRRLISMITGLVVALSALQAQNYVSVNDVAIQDDNTAVLLVDLQNETVFTAFQMDLKLPEGFEVATTVNEDDEEVLDITLSADRKKTTHSLSYNVLDDGTIRFASFSTTNATFKGTSGTLVQIVLKATESAVAGNYNASLDNVRITATDGTEYLLDMAQFGVSYSKYVPVNVVTVNDVELNGIGDKAVLAVDLQNETEFVAFMMDLQLPAGFVVPTTTNEDGEEVLDITLNANRKKSTHSLSYNVLDDGTIRFASFSSTNATFKGTSGTIVEIALMATEEADESIRNGGMLSAAFTTAEAVDYNLGTMNFRINYSKLSEADAAVLDSANILIDEIWKYEGTMFAETPEYAEILLYECIYQCVDALQSLDAYSGGALYAEYLRIKALFEELKEAIPQMYALKKANDAFKNHIYATVYPGMGNALIVCETVNEFVETYRENPTGILQEIQTMTSHLDTARQEYEDSYIPDVNLSLIGGQYGRCILNGNVVLPEGDYAASVQQGSKVTMYFVPFEGYTLTNMTRNGEEVTVRDNYYEESVMEDVVYSNLRFEQMVDTVMMEKVDTIVKVEVDTIVLEKVDTVFVTEIEELPTPIITNDNGVVSITCEQEDVVILYAINGEPINGNVYTEPFEVAESAVISAIAIRCSEAALLNVMVNGMAQSQVRAVSLRYYTENGIEVSNPNDGITIVVAKYADGSMRTYKMVKK